MFDFNCKVKQHYSYYSYLIETLFLYYLIIRFKVYNTCICCIYIKINNNSRDENGR